MQTHSATDLLEIIKQQLCEQTNRPKYELLIRPLTAVSYDDNVLVVSAANEMNCKWVREQFGEIIVELTELITGSRASLEVIPARAGEDGPAIHHFSDDGHPTGKPDAPGPVEELEFRSRSQAAKPLLNPHYSFSEFVVGANNQFCYSACWQVAQRPGQSYNPMFIYGGVGLGKTHLMHAIGHEVWNNKRADNVVYVTSEKFTNDFIEHVRTGKRMSEFHRRYRQADVLLIDDIQFLSGKAETQSEFFHTFMELVEAGKQIIISSDRPPRTLKGIEERLISRFGMGLVADIADPSLETRVAILRQKASQEKVNLPDEVCYFIADRVTSNVRELEGALTRLLAFSDFSSSPPTIEFAARVLADILDTSGIRREVSMRQIINAVCEYFNISDSLLLSSNRSKRVAQARMIAMYFAREFTNLTLSQIGTELGNRDHSTVSHGASKITAEIVEDPYIEQAISQISRMLK
ncbi:MAG: chromosomal replication initiator protein DnaA [Planctomycetales bacterium]|nr:chromosomal replication initiator protein DnaA [bacterium]UNM07891.1 MAG: chromosomal replication initiator protein DnaA [Planctomycetales bacterium]